MKVFIRSTLWEGSKYRYVYIPVKLISDELEFIKEYFLEDEILHKNNPQKQAYFTHHLFQECYLLFFLIIFSFSY